jgi:hypothetical protein
MHLRLARYQSECRAVSSVLGEATAMAFYVLARKSQSEYGSEYDTEFLAAEDARYGEAPRCPVCGEFTGMRQRLPPFRVELELQGRQFGDVVTGSGGSDLLVSPRFEDIYRSHGLTGLEGFEPVEIVQVRSRRRLTPEPPAYRRADVAPSETAIDLERAGVARGGPIECSYCLRSLINGIRGVAIDEATWGGEDVFYPRGLPGTMVVSERFHDVCLEHGITNLKLVEAPEFVETFGLNEI